MTEKAVLFMVREGMTLKPKSRFDASLLAKFREGVPISADLQERRNEGRNRLYWSVLQAVCDATGKWPNSEALHWALKIKLGYIEEISSIDGEIMIRPRSIAFGRMGEQEFREYFDNAMQVIQTEVCPGLSIDDLLSLGKARIA